MNDDGILLLLIALAMFVAVFLVLKFATRKLR